MFYMLSHDRYQYDNAVRSRHTGAWPRERSKQLFSGRSHVQEMEEQKLKT
jgi:hypothetical protein